MKAVFGEDRERELVDGFLPTVGFFVEVGAFQPLHLSQSWHLEQRGWSGLLIEPVPAYVAELRAQRRACVIPVACGSPEQHGTERPLYLKGGRSSLRFQSTDVIQVPVMTLDSILDEASVETVDFLSIDVEGAEVDVLKGISLDRRRPKLVLLEDFADDFHRHHSMKTWGYKRVRRTGNNSWYVPEEAEFAVSLFGRLQLFRKYYLAWPARRFKKAVLRPT